MDFAELYQLGQKERGSWKSMRIHCCTASGCLAADSANVKKALEKAIADNKAGDRVQVVGVGCLGLCGSGPLVETASSLPSPDAARGQGGGVLYEKVTPETAPSIIAALNGGTPVAARLDVAHPFFASQTKIVCEASGKIDAERIEEYIAVGGYQALHHVVTDMPPAAVVKAVTEAGLRGRGGAGYPTGLKWATVARTPSSQKYVVCNGDEGDPGAFMNRSEMEGDPHRLLEGMAIAGYAVGAAQGYIYVRGEYPLAVERLTAAIRQAERRGLLGARVFDSAFQFRVDIRIGAGAFVCGEETALIASIEGGRGHPRPRPPFPAQSGLWGHPTLINNVETLSTIPSIIRFGGEWYAAHGTEKSKGTKVFALAGKIVNTGLAEVPFGITLREVLFDIGGGIPNGHAFKAVQTGGPSGGCVPAQFLDMPLDYESLASVGSIMGSGGLIVMDDSSCMVDVARFYMDFCVSESCGKCVPCRAGTIQASRILESITAGAATLDDLARLEELCDYMRQASLCGLGQTAPNPVMSTLHYFRDEYRAHIVDHDCPAGVCTFAALSGSAQEGV
jgi:bidirectional [NiFe] hydrogenase diaphorase subunit